jgi:hypothetical protein
MLTRSLLHFIFSTMNFKVFIVWRVVVILSVAALTARAAHPFLCTDAAGGKVALVSGSGKVEWEFACEHPQDCWITPDGNFFFCFKGGVVEKLSDGRTLWEYHVPEGSEVHSCQPLANGHYLLMENGPCRIVEVDTLGEIKNVIRLTPPPVSVSVHDQFRGVRRTAEGHYLVCRKGEHVVEELDSDGKSLRRIPVAGDVHMALRLPDGHLLLALGEGHKIQELDENLKVVWELSENEVPGNPLRLVTGFQRLPNGNTIVCNYLGHGFIGKQPEFFEITRDKKLVWEFADHAHFKTINQIHLADMSDDVTKGKILR